MRPKIIEQDWLDYEARVIHKNAGPIQRQETKAAYYSGAFALFYSIISRLTPGTEPERDDLDMMDAIQEELDEFVNEVAVRAFSKGPVQ